MKTTVTIGDFSRMTHLSIKTLRHYHDVGLLAPAEIEPTTGYRYYARSQVPVAQIIRRFRDVGMPVEQVRALLAAPTPAARNDVIRAHLDRLQSELAQTQANLRSLRALLERPNPRIDVEYRTSAQTMALAISERVTLSSFAVWWLEALTEVHEALRSIGLKATGAPGALFATELFSEEEGDVVVFVPVDERTEAVGRVRSRVIPAAELAITVHSGGHDEIDRAYGALGTHVTEHELGVDGPVREYYPVGRFDTPDANRWRTEIAWPIFQASTGSAAHLLPSAALSPRQAGGSRRQR